MKKMHSFSHILILTFIFIAAGCSKNDNITDSNPTYPISGDWTITVNSGVSDYGPYFMKIYNTSFGKDSVWIDDNNTFWNTKSKVKVNMTNLTFSGDDTQNVYYDCLVSYKNGKIVGKDSIYFEVNFSDDPDNLTWFYSGHRKRSDE